MEIKEFDDVVLKDGRTAGIVEVLDSTHFLADVGDGPSNWENIAIELKDIAWVYNRPNNSKQTIGECVIVFYYAIFSVI